jgi:hypothetical protein
VPKRPNTTNNDVEKTKRLLSRLTPIPEEWIKEAVSEAKGSMKIEQCSDYRTLVKSWEKAMRWTEGLDHGLAVMLASIASTQSIGDQLWIKVIGPAACGKSTLCEAVSVNKKYVIAKSTIRGFHSGYRSNGSDGKDGKEAQPLARRINRKTLVTKDGDTLLQSPNKDQILSEARDIYDGVSRADYRNGVDYEVEGLRTTWILAGTASLRSIDQSELGERFLDCVIMDGIDSDMEDEVLWRVVNRAEKSLSFEANGRANTQHEPDMAAAMGLTGGYIDWLKEKTQEKMESISTPKVAMLSIMRMGKLVAYMRARPSSQQEETAEREFGARLVSQHMRLAKCLALVLNQDTVNQEVLARVRRVALETARGRTLDMAYELYAKGRRGLQAKSLATLVGQAPNDCRNLLRFLKKIEAVEVFKGKNDNGTTAGERWRLTDQLTALFEFVLQD